MTPEEITGKSAADIKENLLYQMRNWITEYYEAKEGKDLPEKVEDFYTRNERAMPARIVVNKTASIRLLLKFRRESSGNARALLTRFVSRLMLFTMLRLAFFT